jgi:hypothetical protein
MRITNSFTHGHNNQNTETQKYGMGFSQPFIQMNKKHWVRMKLAWDAAKNDGALNTECHGQGKKSLIDHSSFAKSCGKDADTLDNNLGKSCNTSQSTSCKDKITAHGKSGAKH